MGEYVSLPLKVVKVVRGFYVQFWQVVMVLFLLLKFDHELDAGVSATASDRSVDSFC